MFWKKKEVQTPPMNFQSWENDFGFLFLIMERKKNLTKTYILNVYSDQLQKNDFMTDESVLPQVEECVNSIMSTLSENYVKFLIMKYFNSYKTLVSFITEDVFNDITASAIASNNKRIKTQIIQDNIRLINKQNAIEKICKNEDKK